MQMQQQTSPEEEKSAPFLRRKQQNVWFASPKKVAEIYSEQNDTGPTFCRQDPAGHRRGGSLNWIKSN